MLVELKRPGDALHQVVFGELGLLQDGLDLAGELAELIRGRIRPG